VATIEEQLKAIQQSLANADVAEPDPDEPWVPAPNAIVEETPAEEPVESESKGKKGWLQPTSMKAEKPPLPDVQVNMNAVMKASQAKIERDEKQQKGITRSVMEGLTFDLYDEASAYMEAEQKGIPYRLPAAATSENSKSLSE